MHGTHSDIEGFSWQYFVLSLSVVYYCTFFHREIRCERIKKQRSVFNLTPSIYPRVKFCESVVQFWCIYIFLNVLNFKQTGGFLNYAQNYLFLFGNFNQGLQQTTTNHTLVITFFGKSFNLLNTLI